ncbi:hypothetical protein [Streptomyces sp. NPDC048639]|uniref:hypothetical protein n=1 Tax=Streptomyces sp. NPDC048639 TaxID=3365581 RepID=UPI0037150F1C
MLALLSAGTLSVISSVLPALADEWEVRRPFATEINRITESIGRFVIGVWSACDRHVPVRDAPEAMPD